MPNLFVADSDKKYYLIDGEFYTEDLKDSEDVCHISRKDFSSFERLTCAFLMLQSKEFDHA
jgi:hypothetical protein